MGKEFSAARRALVTGAAAGLAASVAGALPLDGFEAVSITYRETSPDATVSAIERGGARASAHRVDFLDDRATVEDALRLCIERDGPFDTLVHGVGPLLVRRFERCTPDDYLAMFDGNVRSAVLSARAVLPAARIAGFGRIVFFGASGAGTTDPHPGFTLYQAAKSALTAFARSLALEEAPAGITVNVVEPGDIRDKTRTRAQALATVARNPRGRPGTSEDVTDVVRFLVERERDFLTGATIAVTGGLIGPDEQKSPHP